MRFTPFRIVLLYVIVGSLWILFSDRILALLIEDSMGLTRFQTYKGWSFVVVTAVLFYILISRFSSDLELATRNLYESERYNRNLFEISPIGLAICRMDGTFIDVNEAYAKIIGRTVEEVLRLTYWNITPEKYVEQEQIQLESLRTQGRYGPWEKEYIHKDGHLVPVRLQGLIIQRNGEDLIWSSVEDITDRKRAEQELMRLNQDLEQRVNERTKELELKIKEIERMNRLFVGRELRMVELKEKIKELESRIQKS